jgi:malate dehydrogenase (oxaloacetate-decarboxylating)
MDYQFARDANGKLYLQVNLTDYALINNALLNKGMAFPYTEREKFGLLGLIPPQQSTLSLQRTRSYETLKTKSSDIEKYVYLRELQDSNETLFYSLVSEHIEEIMPIVYTPVVGAGCERFSHIYRRPRGLFIAYPDRKHIDTILANPRFDKVKVIVVSDGERILGLGDQGAGGMGIPIGKLALYTACAGIHPAETLPILLDSGTNNNELLIDPLYIGWQHERIRDEQYAEFVNDFIVAIKKRFPHVLLQWEDFAQQNANPLLERYANQLCTFNDDIQGTAAVAAGTLFAAIQMTGGRLRDQRIVIVGAGSAGCGISQLIMQAMIDDGLTPSAARERFFLVDQHGLLTEDTIGLLPFQKVFTQSKEAISTWHCDNSGIITLKDVVTNIHPTLLIGVSGQPGIFTQEIVKEMAAHVERPIIFPLSNPTTRSEALPQDLLRWTNEQAIIGTGSPFGNVQKNGQLFRIDQTNNCYIFPGMGLGLITVKAKRVTSAMFMAAAKALANCSPAKKNANANLLPPLTEIRTVSLQVAIAVAKEAISSGFTEFDSTINLEKHIENNMWIPEYLSYEII